MSGDVFCGERWLRSGEWVRFPRGQGCCSAKLAAKRYAVWRPPRLFVHTEPRPQTPCGLEFTVCRMAERSRGAGVGCFIPAADGGRAGVSQDVLDRARRWGAIPIRQMLERQVSLCGATRRGVRMQADAGGQVPWGPWRDHGMHKRRVRLSTFHYHKQVGLLVAPQG